MSELQSPVQPPEYWTTLSEYHQDAEYLARMDEEFYPEAKPERFFEAEGISEVTPMQRRTFLKLGGFAALAAALQGCERPVSQVLPYVNQPEEIALGKALYYASTCTECAASCGTLIKTREGRPIKLEGNPDHPVNRGGLCARGQAGIMGLYDPDRLKYPARLGRKGQAILDETVRMATLDAEIAAAIKKSTGKVVLLTSTVTGPANTKLISTFLAAGNGRFEHVVYDPAKPGVDERIAHEASFGQAVTPRYLWSKADVVLCLGGDPLAQSNSNTETQRDFAAKRKPTAAGMSRVYVFEPAPTLTGMSADYRTPVRPEELLPLGLAIAHQLIVIDGKTRYAGDAQVRSMLADYTPSAVAAQLKIKESDIARVAASLAAAPGRSIVHATGQGSQSKDGIALLQLANFLNDALGNYESTIDVTLSPSQQAAGASNGIVKLASEMKAGAVDVLIVNGVNPVYTLPASLGFADAMKKVGLVISLGLQMDETTSLADLSLPGVHGLESWGDAEPQKGLYSLQQPAIHTLFGPEAAQPFLETRSWQESLMAISIALGSTAFVVPATAEGTAARTATWLEFIRATWQADVFAAADVAKFEENWSAALRLGVYDTVGADKRNGAFTAPTLDKSSLSSIRPTAQAAGAVFVAQQTIVHGDGRSMTNPFLLEFPDPVSKVCWDNYASISPAYAKQIGVSEGDHLKLVVNGTEMKIPAWIQPGVQKDVVMVHLGWGRDTADGIGHQIGSNAAALTTVEDGRIVASGLAVTVEKQSGNTKLANIQGHNYLYTPKLLMATNKRKGEVPEGAERAKDGTPVYARPIIGETTFKEWTENPFHGYPNHVDHNQNPPSIWERSHKYVGHHWGMAIDLNACNGCGACTIACSIENNVPVVGKDEVIKGREMFWIRIDRYYRGDVENPDFVQQALMCQHCDNAPCETVCPVIATMHNDEGLNVMTYNRCVGTRYCANNCPYKVRRFNFWQYSSYRTGPYDNVKQVSPLELVLNPDVTVRTRGVMEKCTFCSQRIRNAKDEARLSGQPMQDGAVVTACQQSCPAQAITFGDRNDPNSEISKQWLDPRAYGLLADLTTDPSVRYMALVRNRDEASPYRTKYQSHRLHHGDDHGHDTHDEHASDAKSDAHSH